MKGDFDEHVAGSGVVELGGVVVLLVDVVEHVVDVFLFEGENDVSIDILEDLPFQKSDFFTRDISINGPVFHTVGSFETELFVTSKEILSSDGHQLLGDSNPTVVSIVESKDSFLDLARGKDTVNETSFKLFPGVSM